MANGGIIGPVNTSTTSVASGVWKLDEAKEKVSDGKWPVIITGNLTTTNLLIHLDINNSSCYPGSGTAVTNLIAGQPSGVLTNGPTYATDSTGGYIQFDGVNDYILFSTTTPLQVASGGFTKSWWVYLSNGFPTGFSTLDGWSGASKHCTYVYNDQLWSARVGTNNDGGGPMITDYHNKWFNVTVTNSIGSNYRYYINGQFTIQKAAAWTYAYSGTYQVCGLINDGFYMNGRLGVYHFYNRILTDAEILENFNAYRTRFGI